MVDLNIILHTIGFIAVILLIVCIVCGVVQTILVLRERKKLLSLRIDSATLRHVTTLMPWINRQIEKSTEVIFQNYARLVDVKALERNITEEKQNEIINTIRTHFYGTIPKSLSETLFKYIDQRQIDILIYTSYRRENDGFFFVGSNNTINEQEV